MLTCVDDLAFPKHPHFMRSVQRAVDNAATSNRSRLSAFDSDVEDLLNRTFGQNSRVVNRR